MKKALILAFVAMAAIPLRAAEEAPLSLFAGNVGNALWTLVIFVLVVVVLGKFAWGPILSLLKQREDFIHKSLSDAKHDRDEAEARLKEYAARQIELQTTRVVQQLRQEAVELSVTIASKILQRNISKEDNDKLIADAL